MSIDFDKVMQARSIRVCDTASSIRDLIEETRKSRPMDAAFAATRFVDKGDDSIICTRAPVNTASTLPAAEDLQKLANKAGLPWDSSYLDRTFPVWSSDERVNRYGDIDRQNWDFRNYNRNPIVLLSHAWDALPIGGSIYHKVEKREDGDYKGPALKQFMVFATKEMNPVADSVQRLWKARFLRTVSVGFRANKVIDVPDPEERKALGLGSWGLIFDDLELMEVSPCSVPALPSAHNAALREETQPQDVDTVREVLRSQIVGTSESHRWKEIDQNIRTVWRTLHPEIKVREHLDVEAPINFELSSSDTDVAKKIKELQDSILTLTSGLSAVQAEIRASKSQTATQLQTQVSATQRLVDDAIKGVKVLKESTR